MHVRLDRARWRSTLVAALTLLTLLILGGVAAYSYLNYQQTAANLVQGSERQQTYMLAERLRDELAGFVEELETLARTQDIYRSNPSAQQAALQRERNRLSIFDGGVVLLDNYGRVVATVPDRPEIIGSDWSERDFFHTLLSSTRPHFSNVTDVGLNGSQVVVLSVPVTGENEEFVGVLAGMFRLGETGVSPLYASIVRQRVGQSGNTYIVDDQGRLLYDSTPGQIGGTLPVPQQTGFSPQGLATRTNNAAGNEVIASYAAIPGTPWTLVRENDWHLATSDVQRFARTFLVLLGLGMALPALGVALLIRQQSSEIRARDRVLQEERVSGLIQRQLLPHHVPMLAGWGVGIYHRPDLKAGGDFHDLFLMPDGRLALIVGQMGDIGLAASHILSTVRAALRGAARLQMDPGSALNYANALLCPEVQSDGCVALLFGVLDPATATLHYACAGFHRPWRCSDTGTAESEVMGIALGTTLDTNYEQHEMRFQPGEKAIFYSAGLSHAHNAKGEPFGLHRTCEIVAAYGDDPEEGAEMLAVQFKEFTDGSGAEPEDVTVIILQRLAESPKAAPATWRQAPAEAEPTLDRRN